MDSGDTSPRKIPMYQLMKYRSQLKFLRSFSDPIEQCNFATNTGWRGKTYVTDGKHDMPFQPSVMRGIDVLGLYYLQPCDYVVLTQAQYDDFMLISGGDIC
jgi:hypothetical protein